MPLPVMRASLALFPGVLQQVYGMTEQSGVVSVLGRADHANPAVAHRLISAGKAITGVEIEIREPGTGEPVPTGQPGEIWVRSEQIMAGYWGKPEASADTITQDGWLRSGDGGHIDADGYLYVTDRIKDMIISGAENIYPAEIERVLAEHPAIADVAVIGVPDERWGEVPKAVVVARAGSSIDVAELLAYCRRHVAGFKCPQSRATRPARSSSASCASRIGRGASARSCRRRGASDESMTGRPRVDSAPRGGDAGRRPAGAHKPRTRSMAASTRSTAWMVRPSMGFFGALALGTTAIEKPSLAASLSRS
jgi:acyl-CoA synthetase (AMP-forming)/AMP-acid ligase II